MKSVKRIPFDIEKAKAGAKVVTQDGYPVRIGFFDLKVKGLRSFPIVGAIDRDGKEDVRFFTAEGKFSSIFEEDGYDLFIEEEVENDSNNQDETIRKALISYFQSFPYNSLEDAGVDAKDVIAWLEKQGEQETLCDKCKKSQPSHSCQDITALGICAVEHEQKTTDKFEINPDKWYVCKCLLSSKDGNNTFIQGTQHLGKDILTYGLDIEPEEYPIYFRPWSIIDAKPGDILQSSRLDYKGIHYDSIFIFDSLSIWESYTLDDLDRVVALDYCYLNVYSDKMEFGVQGPDCVVEVDTITPATKEKRELLFQKMKEDGYEWNSSTKELKKIDAFPAEKDTKIRSMTNQELADWLRKCPEEFREFTFKDGASWVYSYLDYLDSEADEPAKKNKLIRRNHGEWQEPLIEE